MKSKINRRDAIRNSTLAVGVLGLGGKLAMAQTCLQTPAQMAGPYYPEIPSSYWEDADLTSHKGASGVAQGVPVYLYGRVFAGEECKPFAGAKVEIWQADHHGRYKHSADEQTTPLDPSFQYFGVTETDRDGVYRFKTIVPGKYPGRTRHIHMRVVLPSGRNLVTQLYFENFRAENAKDVIYRSLAANNLEDRVTTKLVRRPELPNAVTARFDITIDGVKRSPAVL